MRLSCRGLTSREIAERLGTTPGNVGGKRHVAFQKLGAKTLAEACAEMVRRGQARGDIASRTGPMVVQVINGTEPSVVDPMPLTQGAAPVIDRCADATSITVSVVPSRIGGGWEVMLKGRHRRLNHFESKEDAKRFARSELRLLGGGCLEVRGVDNGVLERRPYPAQRWTK